MYQDLLETLLHGVDCTSNTVFGVRNLNRWPVQVWQRLTERGLLVEAEPASVVLCDECERGCLMKVQYAAVAADEPQRAYIFCTEREEIGLVWIPLERLRQWRVSKSGLARLVALLSGARSLDEIVPGRLWWLGPFVVGQQRADLFLAIGTRWPDAATLFSECSRLNECSLPLVLLPGYASAETPFAAHVKVLSLARLMTVNDKGVHVDVGEIKRAVGKGRPKRVQPVVPFSSPAGCTWPRVMIEFVSDTMVKIVAGSVVDHKDFAEMGFRNSRKSKVQGEPEPDKLWECLRALAFMDGSISWKDDRAADGERYKIKKNVSDLRKRLRNYFPGIPGDPFEPYRRERAYKTRFVLRAADSYRQSLR